MNQFRHVTTARVGDAERDACIERLTTELVQGRITQDEFSEKSQAALEARTREELNSVCEDLGLEVASNSAAVANREAVPAVTSDKDPAGLTLSAGDLLRGGGYVVISAVVCFVALGWLIPDVFSQLLLWLFSLVSAGVGAALGRYRSR